MRNKKWYMSLPSQLKTRLSSVFVTIWRVQRSFFFIGEIVAIVVGVGSGGVFELTQSASGDIYEFIERRNVNVLAGEVWDDSECCNWTVEDGPVEFSDDVGATLVCDMTMSGPRYLAHILRLRDFSIAVFLIRMRLPSVKSYLMMVVACSCLKRMVALIRVA